MTTGTLIVTNAAGTGRLIAGQNGKGTFILSGGTVMVDQLYATNVSAGVTNSIFGFAHGTVTINKGSVIKTDNADFKIGTSANETATLNILGGANIFETGNAILGETSNLVSVLNVSGLGTLWANTGDLDIGRNSDNNRLLITGGARVTTDFATLGPYPWSRSNLATVSGAGSFWTNRLIFVGSSGSANRLVITNGGNVTSDVGALGANLDGTNNEAVVTGASSSWNSRLLDVGGHGGRNRLLITDGAVVANSTATMGSSASSSNNLAVVTGAGSVWTNVILWVGRSGSGNQLLISNGGRVQTLGVDENAGFIGEEGTSSNNVAVVTGPNSVWSLGSDLDVGRFGSRNRLVITNGGLVSNERGSLGSGPTSTNNEAVITDAGSFWNNRAELFISGRLLITNGGLVGSRSGLIESATADNEALVTGAGSTWSNRTDLYVGGRGAANRLLITSSGTVFSSNAVYVGFTVALSSNNLLAVSGGTLRVRNSLGTGTLDVRSGTNRFDAGLIDVDELILTNLAGVFVFNGGTLLTRGGLVANSRPFVVGANGLASAIWDVRDGMTNVVVTSAFTLGQSVVGCQLLITNGQSLQCDPSPLTIMGDQVAASNTLAVVSGIGSLWSNASELRIGNFSAHNRMVVSGRGAVENRTASIGHFSGSDSNEVSVSGAGSVWRNRADLQVGRGGAGTRLLLANGGAVFASNNVVVGVNSSSSNNVVSVASSSTLTVTNPGGNGTLDLRRGQLNLNGGTIQADRLLATVGDVSIINFLAGALSVGSCTISNQQALTVGNSSLEARLNLTGNGVHRFGNGLVIRSRGTLTGNGTIMGALMVENGGTLSPGASVGKLMLSQSPTLQGTTVMEISKSGSLLTNDLVELAGPLSYGGRLTVTKIGPSALSAGDRFQLFSASGYSGAFSPITLPALAAGLSWTNKLLLDGSIEVFSRPKIASIEISGGNVVIRGSGGVPNGQYDVLTSTDVTLPLVNWSRVTTEQFDSKGNFVFTRAIEPSTRQRFFALQWR